jgi:hypothetical protein
MSLGNMYFYIGLGTIAFPFLLSVFIEKKSHSRDRFQQLFTLLLSTLFVTNTIYVVLEKTIQNSNPVFHFSIPIQFLLVLEMFYLTGFFHRFKALLRGLTLLFFILDLLQPNHLLDNNHFSTIYTFAAIVLLGLIYVYKSPRSSFQSSVLIPIMLCYTPMFIFALFESSIQDSTYLTEIVLPLHITMNLLLYGSFVRALYVWRLRGNHASLDL